MPKTGKLAGNAEVQEILKVSRARVAQLVNEHKDFPKTVDELECGRIWRRADIEKWQAKRLERRGVSSAAELLTSWTAKSDVRQPDDPDYGQPRTPPGVPVKPVE